MKLGVLLAAVMLVLAGCDAPKPLKVGVLYSGQGINRNFEEPMLRAVEMALATIEDESGEVIELVSYDAKSEKERYLRGFEQLTSIDKVDLLVADYRRISKPKGVRVLSSFDFVGKVTGGVDFWGSRPAERLIPAIGWGMREFGLRVYYIGEDSEQGRARQALVRREIESRGGQLVGSILGVNQRADWVSVGNGIEETAPDFVVCDLKGSLGLDMLKVLISFHGFTREYPRLFTSFDEPILNHIESVARGVNILVEGRSTRYPRHEKAFGKAVESVYGKGRMYTQESLDIYLGVLNWAGHERLSKRKHTVLRALYRDGETSELWSSAGTRKQKTSLTNQTGYEP